MKLQEFLDYEMLDKPTTTPQELAMKNNVNTDEVIRLLEIGTRVEMEHTSDPRIAREIALDHLGERLDYYERLADAESGELDEVYPGQSSGRLKNYVKRKYGGEINCAKARKVINDPDVSNFIRKRAIWYNSLHCKGTKQVREDDTDAGSALTIFDVDETLFHTEAKVKLIGKDGNVRILTSEQFNDIKNHQGPGERLDLSEFTDAKLFHDTSKPIENMWRTAQDILEGIGHRPGSRVVVITARENFDDFGMFVETFHKHGLDISEENFFTVGGAENKKTKILELLQDGNYTEARMFDDHQPNLVDFLSLSEEPGLDHILFEAIPVGKGGRIGTPIFA